jgi:hypothetical protein
MGPDARARRPSNEQNTWQLQMETTLTFMTHVAYSTIEAMQSQTNHEQNEHKEQHDENKQVQDRKSDESNNPNDNQHDREPNPHQELIQWIESCRPPKTTAPYKTYEKQYRKFAEQQKLNLDSPETVGLFMKHLAVDKQLAINTINKSALSAIANMYRYEDTTPPTKHKLIQYAKKAVEETAKPAKPKLPLTKQHLIAMADMALERDSFLSTRNMTLILLMTVGMMRESEAVQLETTDVWIERLDEPAEDALFIYVEKSKTDRQRTGHSILVGTAEDQRICPIFWYNEYLKFRNNKSKWFFHQFQDNDRLADSTPCGIVQRMLEEIGITNPKDYGSHSARKGGATRAAHNNIEQRLIKRHGNWKSDAVNIYITESQKNRLSVSRAILNG